MGDLVVVGGCVAGLILAGLFVGGHVASVVELRVEAMEAGRTLTDDENARVSRMRWVVGGLAAVCLVGFPVMVGLYAGTMRDLPCPV